MPTIAYGHYSGYSIVTAKTVMTLNAAGGSLIAAAALTLRAGMGIQLLDTLNRDASDTVTTKNIVIESDFESAGDGTLTVITGKKIYNPISTLLLTVWDVDLAGGVEQGSQLALMHGAKVSQTVGLGNTAHDMHINLDELQRITGGARVRPASEMSGFYGSIVTAACVLGLLALACGCAARASPVCESADAPKHGKHKRDHVV